MATTEVQHCIHWHPIGGGVGSCDLGRFGGRMGKLTCTLHCAAIEPPAGYVEIAVPPPDWHARARSLWALFHSRPLAWAGEEAERQWLAWFESQLHELGCSCRSNWTTLEREMPLDLSSPLAYARSGWWRHERVNADLGKPPFTWEQAVQTHHWEGLIDGPSTAGRSTIEGR